MSFEEPFQVMLENENRMIDSKEDYLLTAMKYV